VIRPLSKNLRRTLCERLAGSGVVRAEKSRILGVFPARRWPSQDGSHEAEVRRLVTQALVQQVAPDRQRVIERSASNERRPGHPAGVIQIAVCGCDGG